MLEGWTRQLLIAAYRLLASPGAQAKLRLIADEAEAGAALPAAEPVPAVLLGGAAGGKGLGARATAALDHASPLTPEPSPKPNSSSVAGAWRSDAESTNGR